MKKKAIFVGVAAMIGIFTMYFAVNSNGAVEVELAKVQKGNLNEYVEETAMVKSLNSRVIYAPADGNISMAAVEVGSKVEEGDILAEIEGKELYIQRESLFAEKSAIEAQYHEAVKPRNVEEIKKYQAQVDRVQTSWEEAKRAEENSKKMYEEGAVSYDEYRKVMANLIIEETNLKGAQMDLALLQKGPSENIRKQFEGQMNGIRSQIDIINKRIADLTIKAPIAGIVLGKEIKEGTYMQRGMEMLEIGDGTNLYLESDILVGEIGDIAQDAEVEIENNDLNIKSMKGYVSKVYPKAFSKISDLGIEQKRVPVEIQFVDTPSKLKPGYDMDIKIIINKKKDILLIPESALFKYNGEDYVFVNDNGTAVLRKVIKGIKSDDLVEINDGLTEGEEIILSPSEKIEEGIKIKNKKS